MLFVGVMLGILIFVIFIIGIGVLVIVEYFLKVIGFSGFYINLYLVILL